MKKLLIIAIAFVAPLMGYAQDELDSLLNEGYEITKTYSSEEIETHAVMPEFPGGNKGLREYLRKNLKYPSLAFQNGFEGLVHVKFVVEKDGSISNVVVSKCIADSKSDKYLKKNVTKQEEIKKKVTALYAKEGSRVVRKMPKWKPGTLDGEPKRVSFTLPIQFIGY